MPGSNARALEKARGLAADALIFDLEDAVAHEAKASARATIATALAAGYGGRELLLRTNGLDTPWGSDDLVAAAAMAITPLFVAVPALDNIFGWSLGLSAHQPRTNDWRPLLPWAGATIAGTGLMRMVLARGVPKSVASWDAGNVATRALTWGGRHSLLVYLVHQPVFLGVVYLAALAAPPSESPAVAEESGFQTSCVAACAPSGASSGVCEALCECVSEATRTAGLWRPMMDSKLTPAQSLRVDEITRQCAPSREGAGARRPLENQ